MKPKKKPCKGTGIAKGYGCGKPTIHRVYGIGKLCGCYSNWLLTSEAGKIKLQKATLKATEPRRELEKEQKARQERRSLSYLLQNTINTFHKYIRARDKGKPCIACGVPYKSNFHASHFFSAGKYSSLRFHEDNVHAGCQKCNLFLEGNIDEYTQRLPSRIGQERFNKLLELAKEYKRNGFKWDREELNRIRNYYKQKLKDLT
jgi:hypothetical protein